MKGPYWCPFKTRYTFVLFSISSPSSCCLCHIFLWLLLIGRFSLFWLSQSGLRTVSSSCWPWRKADPNLNDLEQDQEVIQLERSGAPSTQQYCIKAGKKAVEVLQVAANFVPAPFAKEAFDIILALITVCEQVTALEGQLDDLKDHLCTLGLIIFHSAEEKHISPTTEADIARLGTKLKDITLNLQGIQKQSRFLLVFFANTNKDSVDGCIQQLKTALTEFRLSHDINTEKALQNILQHLEELPSKLSHIDEGVQQANRGLEKLLALAKSDQTHTASVATSSGMPAQLLHFRGRPGMIAEIGTMLCSDDPTKTRIAILATGGMGKTSLAREVISSDIVCRKFDDKNRFWVGCRGVTSFAIFLQVLVNDLRIKTNMGNFEDDIRKELMASDAPRLIILDNFETPWDTTTSEQVDVERVLCSIAKLSHIAILLTMRSNQPPSKNIQWSVRRLQPIEPAASRQIYTDIDPSAAGHEALDELLTALGHLPYAVTLVAALGKESEYLPDALLRKWKEGGPGILEDEKIKHSIGLSVGSNLMKTHPEAQSLFKILSMLPAGTTRDHLSFWAADLGVKEPLAISILNRTALIAQSGDTLFVYPVVQSYMEHSGHISLSDRNSLQEVAFKFILDHKSSPGSPNFKDDLKALMTEDTNLQGILTFSARQRLKNRDNAYGLPNDEILLDSLVTFGLYQLWSKPCLGVADLAVEVARSLDSKRHLAEALTCVGQILHHLAKYDEACRALREARSIFHFISNPLRAGQAGLLLMFSYGFASSFLATSYLALDVELDTYFKELDEDDEPYLRGTTQLIIGYILWRTTRYDMALQYLSDARDALQGEYQTFETAHCFYTLGRCYLPHHKYSEAIDAAKNAVKGFEYLGLDGPTNDARALEGICLLRLEDYDAALRIFESYLQAAQEIGDVLAVAEAFELIAQVLEHEKDVTNVRLCYEGALREYKAFGSTALGQEGRERCESNLLVLNEEHIADDVWGRIQHSSIL